jgi:NAD(P)-dependent dehydrogenase (short-subunit alcohol dehydrogenase family)
MSSNGHNGSISLEGLTVLVTGAGSGIGRATAEIAGAAGATVIVTDIDGQDEVAEGIKAAGGKAEAHALDVTSAQNWRTVVGDVLERHGGIDGLANVAGVVSHIDTAIDQTEEGWERIIAIDLKGAWLGMKAALPAMIANGSGRVVNVASVAGLIGMPNVFAYSAAKGGVIGMTRQASIEYAASGVKFNSICPGVIETPILGDITDELKSHVIAATPTGRLGRPDDIGNFIAYLLGPAGDFITGQEFAIDGGWTAQ